MKKIIISAVILLTCFGGSAKDGRKLEAVKTGDKLVIKIDNEILGQDLFFSSRVRRISGHRHLAAGQTFNPGKVIRFIEQNGYLLAWEPYGNFHIETPEGDNVTAGISDNAIPSFSYMFEIKAKDEGGITVDVTKFFSEEIPGMLPLPGGFKEGKFEPKLSRVTSADTQQDRVNIASLLCYTGAKANFSIEIGYNLLIMETPMVSRREDDRIGYMTVSTRTGSDSDPVKSEKIITRWRVEPRQQDMERHLRGELVEPAKPIVFYMDGALPERFREPVRQGILDWNTAFEKAGFRNAIQVLDLPEELDVSDIKVNMVRYIPTTRANAQGVTLLDPRSGEILQGDIYIFHNLEELLSSWRFVQTSAIDPRVRGTDIPDDMTRDMLRHVAAHEMGHVLGLKHNMRGSYAYPVDSLRSPSFTEIYGTSASIMDYARFNYVAQPGDLQRGVKLSPPVLGPYDILAIQWGYGYFHGTGKEQATSLENLFKPVNDDPMLQFASSYMGAVSPDPSSESDVLGDDIVRSSEYGIANLKLIVSQMTGWAEDAQWSYELLDKRYESVYKQFFKYMVNSAAYAGGRYFYPAGDTVKGGRYENVVVAKQEEAVRFVFSNLRDYPSWILKSEIESRLGSKHEILVREQRSAMKEIITEVLSRSSAAGPDATLRFLDVMSVTLFGKGSTDPLTERLRHDYLEILGEYTKTKKETNDNPMLRSAVEIHLGQLSQKFHRNKKNSLSSLYNRTIKKATDDPAN